MSRRFFHEINGVAFPAAYALRFQTCGASPHSKALRAASALSARQPSSRRLYGRKISGRKTCRLRCLRRCPNAFRGPDLNGTNKTVREYDGPEYEQSDVSTEVECKTSPKHEQH